MRHATWPLLLLLTFLPRTGSAHTWVVRPDGSGDLPTIQQAVDAAASGDVVELAPGTFTGPGNRDILIQGRVLTIRSQGANPAGCTIDCEESGRGFRITEVYGGPVTLQGITITRGSADFGAAVRCDWSGDLSVSDCVFYRNAAGQAGGAVASNPSADFTRCRFIENTAILGGAYVTGAASGGQVSVTFDECQFVGNVSEYQGGAIYFESVPLREATIRRCSFLGNRSQGNGGAIYLLGMSPRIESCTFAGNRTASGGIIECVFCVYFPASPDIRHSILAFSLGGPAVSCDADSHPTLFCSDVYGNEGGDWVGCLSGLDGQLGNFSEDPLFCDPVNGDYGLMQGSPCTPDANPDCGLVGAWMPGCAGPVPVRTMHWGQIKAHFR